MLEAIGINLQQILATIGVTKLFAFIFNKKTGDELRLAISYLHRIRVKDQNSVTRYLLVKSPKTDLFQPPGGVYKYVNDSVLKKLNARDHESFHEKNDLRILIAENKVRKFIKSFDKNKPSWREEGYEREFREELIDTHYLNFSIFNSPVFQYRSRKESGKRWSPFFECHEMLFYDVIDVVLNEEQEKCLKKKLEKDNSPSIYFATEQEIRRRGFDKLKNKDTLKISEHSIHIL